MDGLILAAGLGSRLGGREPSKPLAQLHGVSLLKIAVRQLAGVGINRICVATGFRSDQIKAALPRIARAAGVEVIARDVPNFTRPNGHSVLAGARDFAGEFLLVMADHVLPRAILQKLVDTPLGEFDVRLAIDRNIGGPHVDPEDATWVALGANGAIAGIGKDLERFDAVDCGAFRASPPLLAAIEAAIAAGRPGSLTDGMRGLAAQGRAGTIDIDGAWWIDVDDPAMLELARRNVRAKLPEIFGPAAEQARGWQWAEAG